MTAEADEVLPGIHGSTERRGVQRYDGRRRRQIEVIRVMAAHVVEVGEPGAHHPAQRFLLERCQLESNGIPKEGIRVNRGFRPYQLDEARWDRTDGGVIAGCREEPAGA